jgi:hypothetical protein
MVKQLRGGFSNFYKFSRFCFDVGPDSLIDQYILLIKYIQLLTANVFPNQQVIVALSFGRHKDHHT